MAHLQGCSAVIIRCQNRSTSTCSTAWRWTRGWSPAERRVGARHWDAYARGTIVGLPRGATNGPLARAALEGTAYQIADLLFAMEADSGIQVNKLRADGGASAKNLLLQSQADLLDIPVVRAKNPEMMALGSAYPTSLAVGLYESPDEIAVQLASLTDL